MDRRPKAGDLVCLGCLIDSVNAGLQSRDRIGAEFHGITPKLTIKVGIGHRILPALDRFGVFAKKRAACRQFDRAIPIPRRDRKTYFRKFGFNAYRSAAIQLIIFSGWHSASRTSGNPANLGGDSFENQVLKVCRTFSAIKGVPIGMQLELR